MYRKIDGILLADMIEAAKINLYNNRDELNALNVFPVPDGDTGTNMSLTFIAAASTAKNHTSSAGDVLDAISMAALRGARGNSGVILSQLLRGMAKATKGKAEIGIEEMVEAFNFGSKTAYAAIMKPTEGTILTVFRMMAEHCERKKSEITDLDMFFSEAVSSSYDALELTPELLPKLKQAGVVDSGGKGVCYIIEGMADFFKTGVMPIMIEAEAQPQQVQTSHNSENVLFAYCTEFIILNPDKKKNELIKRYENLGDSIVAVADEDVIKVHIHTNSPGIVISEALKVGALIDIKIDNMKVQNEELNAQQIPEERVPYAFVAIASGEGFVNIYKELGINRIVSGGQSMNPSSDDILKACNATNADVVYVFPNNKNIILSAEQAKELYNGTMVVVPTKNMSEVLSCMVGFAEDATPDENLDTMKDILGTLKSAQITYAVRDSVFDNLKIKQGEIMAISDSSIIAKGKNANNVCISLISKLIDKDVSMVTIYAGADITSAQMDKLSVAATKKFKNIDFAFYRGDQPIYYYLISME
jgi:hypothetical protein